MIIPAIYSIVVLNIHTRKYDKIISNVSSANDINLIAKEEIPSELWNIVCGRKEFSEGRQYHLLATISTGINEMKNNILDSTSQEKLEVASRTCITLSKNISCEACCEQNSDNRSLRLRTEPFERTDH